MARRERTVGLGGTFDHFHKGHERFLLTAASLGERLLIGVTSDKMASGKAFHQSMEPLKKRKQSVISFIQKQGLKAEIVILADPYGPTIEKGKVQLLCVTEETVEGASKINELREAQGMRPLPVHICPWEMASDGQPISSTRIRAGEINRGGQVFAELFSETLQLSDQQRQHFAQAQGLLVHEPLHDSWHKHAPVVAVVGDSSLRRFLEESWPYDLAVYDGFTLRQQTVPETEALSPELSSTNTAGRISLNLIQNLLTALRKQYRHLKVEGEEDLATVALVLLLPLQSRLYYGQPGEGLVELIVTPTLKARFQSVLFPK